MPENHILGNNINYVYVNAEGDGHVADLAGACSHFTFDRSEGSDICLDIQGVGNGLIHSTTATIKYLGLQIMEPFAFGGSSRITDAAVFASS